MRVFISGAEAVDADVEVVALVEDCAGLDDDEDVGVEVGAVAEDCADGVPEGCVATLGAVGACVPEVCAEHGGREHKTIAQPSRTTHPAVLPPGKRLAASAFIRHPNRAASVRNPRVLSNYASVNVLEVYSPTRSASITPVQPNDAANRLCSRALQCAIGVAAHGHVSLVRDGPGQLNE